MAKTTKKENEEYVPEYFACKDRMPGNDRVVLIFSESFFGPDRWEAAAWMGSKENYWAIGGQAFTKKEVKATHWMEMPWTPAKKKYRKKKRI